MLPFLSRQGQFLNVRGEKTPESLFYQMLTSTVAQWPKLKLVDYCCAESIMVEDTDNKSTGTLFFFTFFFFFLMFNFSFLSFVLLLFSFFHWVHNYNGQFHKNKESVTFSLAVRAGEFFFSSIASLYDNMKSLSSLIHYLIHFLNILS